jgi:hypothetical protein
MAKRDSVTGSLTFQMAGDADNFTSGGAPGVEAFRWVCPSLEFSNGITVHSVAASFGDRTGVPATIIDIQKGSTSLLSATVSSSAAEALTLTLANDGSEIFSPGDVLTVDLVAGVGTTGATWSTASAHGNINVQVDFDWLGR